MPEGGITMFEKVNFVFVQDMGFEDVRVTVKGCKWNGEYDVDIYYATQGANYVWETVDREHVNCKRVSTINKKLAAKGFTCKVA